MLNGEKDTVMKDKKTNRSKVITFRMTPAEYQQINNRYKNTTCRKLSDYMRQVLFKGQVTMLTRNQSLDEFMQEMILLRSELSAIGNNFNQSVHRLHTLENIPEFRVWIYSQQEQQKRLLDKVEVIKQKIEIFSDQWLR